LDLPYPVLGIDFKSGKATIPGTGEELVSVTSRHDIGRYVAAVLNHPSETENKIIRVAADTVTGNGLVKLYEQHLGKTFEVGYRPAAEIEQASEEGLKKGDFGAYFGNRIPLFAATGVQDLGGGD
jgi:NmrA-like family